MQLLAIITQTGSGAKNRAGLLISLGLAVLLLSPPLMAANPFVTLPHLGTALEELQGHGDPMALSRLIRTAALRGDFALAHQAFTRAQTAFDQGNPTINSAVIAAIVNATTRHGSFMITDRLESSNYGLILAIFSWAQERNLVDSNVVELFLLAALAYGTCAAQQIIDTWNWAINNWHAGRPLLNGNAVLLYLGFLDRIDPNKAVGVRHWARSVGLVDANDRPLR